MPDFAVLFIFLDFRSTHGKRAEETLSGYTNKVYLLMYMFVCWTISYGVAVKRHHGTVRETNSAMAATETTRWTKACKKNPRC